MVVTIVIAVLLALATAILVVLLLSEWSEKKDSRRKKRITGPPEPTSSFLWFRPYCPCDPMSKAWIERRLGWLSREFPSNIFTDRPLVLPTKEFFPERYEPSKESARGLLVRVCQYMGVSESRVTLKFNHVPNKVWFVDNSGGYVPWPYAAGTYSRSRQGYVITLDTDELGQPPHLVATMAHELAHARLLGQGRVRGRHHDDELLTDLTAFFLGFAIFMANSPRVWTTMFTKWPGTKFNKSEYMTSPMYGYALAHLAWFQGTRKPSWVKHLGSNVINDFKDSAKFLFKTGDSAFRPSSPSRRIGRR